MKRFRLFLLIPLLSILASCASRDSRLARTEYLGAPAVTQAPARGGYDDLSYWDGASASGSPRIKIDLNQQRAYFYKGATLAGVAVVSSGREGYGTPPGKFKVVQKNADHASNLYGDYVDAAGNIVKKDVDVRKDPKPPGTTFRGAPMPYFMRIHGGVGMHAGFLPGYAASHGCIRLPPALAKQFFENAPAGTPVEVVN